MDDVEIVAACDELVDRAAQFAPRTYATPRALLANEKLDFVDIVTRPDTHLPLVALAIQAGVPAICQKPMAPTWPEACDMARLVAEARARVMIHENWRWQPWYREAGRRLRAGDIGQPYTYRLLTRRRDGFGDAPYAHQPYFKDMPRLLIYETLVHHLDTARFLFGEVECLHALARKRNPVIAGEDQVLITVRHDTGVDGSVDGHRFGELEPPNGPVMGAAWIEGETGTLSVDASGRVFLEGRLVWDEVPAIGYRGDSVRATQRHFIDCLRSGAEFESGAEEYLKTFALVEAAYRSAAEGRLVKPSLGMV